MIGREDGTEGTAAEEEEVDEGKGAANKRDGQSDDAKHLATLRSLVTPQRREKEGKVFC